MSDLIERFGAYVASHEKTLKGGRRQFSKSLYDGLMGEVAMLKETMAELSLLQSLSDQNRLTGGWRDIESAPKDGTLILLYGDTPDGPRVTAGNWLAPEHGDYLGDCGGECRCPEYGDPPEPLWWDTDGGFTDEWPPLGWQPLPSPPLPLPGGEEKR